MAIRRRSLIEFEKWLSGEIAVATMEMQNMDEEQRELEKRRAVHSIKLETLKAVADKLAEQPEAEEPPPPAAEPVLPVAEAAAATST